MSAVSLTPEQELQARALAQRIRQAVEGDILQLARLLVSKPEEQIFGQTEFEVRDLVHRLGATALQTHLAGKKTATAAAASSARTAARRRSSTATGRKRR
jgi:F420-0:gamma-glutamyl ligase